MADTTMPSQLLVDKVFLKAGEQAALRGVELFNLRLARDLVRLGYSVSVLATPAWQRVFERELGPDAPRVVRIPDWGSDLLNVVTAAARPLERFDVLLLGNVGKRLLPLIGALRRRRAFHWAVLIAHREATARFVRCVRRLPGHVLAVNRVIARPFQDAGHPSVHVHYGVTDADRFHPPEEPATDDGRTHFCVLGMLDNAWKGADTAVAAYHGLTPDIKASCRLHLASYTVPPAFNEEGILAYPWMGPGEIPGLLRRMDVLIVPSRDEDVMRETFSQAAVQGMLTGLPVLVSDLPILAEKIEGGGGHVFRSTDELAGQMSRLARDAATRRAMGQAARNAALARYVWRTPEFAMKYLSSPDRVAA